MGSRGQVAEWSNAPDSKSGNAQAFMSSNLILSARSALSSFFAFFLCLLPFCAFAFPLTSVSSFYLFSPAFLFSAPYSLTDCLILARPANCDPGRSSSGIISVKIHLGTRQMAAETGNQPAIRGRAVPKTDGIFQGFVLEKVQENDREMVQNNTKESVTCRTKIVSAVPPVPGRQFLI